jgi:hypothetical protein
MKKLIPVAALLLATHSAAQEPHEKPKPMPDKGGERSAAHSPGDTFAVVPDLASVPIPGMNRAIRVVKADPSNPNNTKIVCVYPVLALKTNPKPLSGLPNIVWDKMVDDESGVTTLQFRVTRFTPELCGVIRAAVGKQHAEGLRKDGLTAAQLDVRPLQLEHAIIDCRLGQEVIATAETDSLSSGGDEIHFEMEFTADSLKKFTAKKPVFRFAYSYKRVDVAYGEASTTITDSVVTALNEKVRNVTGDTSSVKQVILAKQKKHLIQSTTTTIRRVVRAGDAGLLTLLTQPVSTLESLFKKEFLDWDKLDGTLRDKMAETLTPLIQTETTALKQHELHLMEWEKNDDTTRDRGGSIGFSIPVGKATGNIEADLRTISVSKLRNYLKDEYGIHTELGLDKKAYKPVKIEVFRFTAATENKVLSDTIRAFLRVAKLTGYVQDSDVPLTWTLDKVTAFCAGENGKLDAQAKAAAAAKLELALAKAKADALNELAKLKREAEGQRDRFAKCSKPEAGDNAQDQVVCQALTAKIMEINEFLSRITAEMNSPQPNVAAFRGKVFDVDLTKLLVDFRGWIHPDDCSHDSTPDGGAADKGMMHVGTAPLMKVATRFVKTATMSGGPTEWKVKNDKNYDPKKGTDISLAAFGRLAQLAVDYKPGNNVATIDRLRGQPWAYLNEFVVPRGHYNHNKNLNIIVLEESPTMLKITDIFETTYSIPLGTFATNSLKK